MVKVKLEFILVGVLLQQPQTGYELQRFMETTGRFMRANTSMTQVYRSLRKMDEEGVLKHRVEPGQGGPEAKRYFVTDDGRATFLTWLNEPYKPASWPGDQNFATQLRFRSQYLGRKAAIELLDTEISYRQQQIARNRNRDRTEWYVPGEIADLELVGAIMNWEHWRGASRMDTHLARIIELRDLLMAGEVPCAGEPNPLQRADEADLKPPSAAVPTDEKAS